MPDDYPKRQIVTMRDGATLPAGWMVIKLLKTFEEAIMGSTTTQLMHTVVIENGHGASDE